MDEAQKYISGCTEVIRKKNSSEKFQRKKLKIYEKRCNEDHLLV